MLLKVNIPDQTFTSYMKLMSVLMSLEGEQVLLVLIYQPPAENQWKIRLVIEELTTQPEELNIDKHNTIVLRDFNLDQMYDPVYTLTGLTLFLLALLLPSIQIIIQIPVKEYLIFSFTVEKEKRHQ